MSEENTPAPRQGLGVWIMSGSMALVMVIGGALVVNSGDKSVEEGNPTATRTVAPGGGHTIEVDESEDAADRSATGEAGVLGAQLTQTALAARGSDIRQTVATVFGGRASAPRPAQQAQGQTARAAVGGATAQRGQPGAAPTVPQLDPPDIGVGAGTPDHVEILRSETGGELQVRFAVPTPPGSYAFPMSVDGTQFVVHVRVGEDGRVTVRSFDGTSTPYHHDPVSGRLTVTVIPDECEYAADPALPPGPVASTSIPVPHKTIPSDVSSHVSTAQPSVAATSEERAEQVMDEARVDGGTPLATGSGTGGHGSEAQVAPAEHGASTEESEASHDHLYADHSGVRDTQPTAVQSSSGENRSNTRRRTPGKPSSAWVIPTPRVTTTSPRPQTPHTASPHHQRSEPPPDRTAVQDDAGSSAGRSPLGPPRKTSYAHEATADESL